MIKKQYRREVGNIIQELVSNEGLEFEHSEISQNVHIYNNKDSFIKMKILQGKSDYPILVKVVGSTKKKEEEVLNLLEQKVQAKIIETLED
jgi:hypothetical protein